MLARLIPLRASFIIGFACFLGIFFVTATSPAQEENPSSSSPAQAEDDSVSPDAPKENGNAEKSPVDHLIYIPYERLSDVIDRFKAKVVLSYEEYLELVKKSRQDQTPAQPERPALISSAKYSAVVKGDVAEITAKLQCEVLKEKWAALPVSFAGAAVGELTTEGDRKVLLKGTGEGAYDVLFPEAGNYTVTLKLLKKVDQSPAGPTLQLNIPPVGITTFELTIPKANQDIKISPRHIEIPTDNEENADGNSSTIAVSLGATTAITANWVPDRSDRPEMDLLTTVTNQLDISVADGLVHTAAKLDYQVLRGKLEEMKIAVSQGQRILDVTSSERLEGWTVEEEEHGQIITVKLLSPVEKSCRLEIHTERSIPEKPLALAGIDDEGTIHGIHSLDVTREQGQITLTHGEELSVVIEKQAGLVRTDLGDKAEGRLGYRYFTPSFQFVTRFEPVQPILDVQHDQLVIFREQRIELNSKLQYTIRKTGLFQIPIALPEDFELLNVSCPQMAEFQHDAANGKLVIQLKERTQGSLNINLRGTLPPPGNDAEKESTTLENLPQIVPEDIRQEEGRLIAFTIPAIELAAEEAAIKNAQPIPVNQIPYSLEGTQVRAAWKYQTRPVEIPVRIIRRPTRLSAETATRVEVQPSGISVDVLVDFHVQYAGVDQFRIAVPEEFSDQIEIEVADKQSVPIQQRVPQPGDEASPWVVWVIQTQRPATGHQRFRMTYDRSLNTSSENEQQDETEQLSEDAKDAGPVVQKLLIPKPLGLERTDQENISLTRSTGEIVVQTDPALSVSVEGTGTGLEPIDVRELTRLPRQGHQAFRYPVQSEDDPIQLTLNVSRYEVAEVVSTVVSKMFNEYVIGTSADLAVRSWIVVRSSQRQRLIVQLPEDAKPMFAQLNGETRSLQKGEKSSDEGTVNYVINVSRTTDSEQPFTLMIQYLEQARPLSETTLRGSVRFSVPRLLTPSLFEAAIQENRCLVWLPEDYVPVSAKSPYDRFEYRQYLRPFSRIEDDSSQQATWRKWIGGTTSAGNFPTEGLAYGYQAVGGGEALELTYWNRSSMTALLTVFLVLIAFVLLKSSWENKILVTLVVLALLAAGWQLAPERVQQTIHSARFGLVFLAGIWIIHGCFQLRYCCRPSPDVTSLGHQTTSPGSTDDQEGGESEKGGEA